MIYFIIITILSVSIDSFACGFSLAYVKGKKSYVIIIVALTVFVMCLLANYLGIFFKDYISEKVANTGGLILIAVGIFNLVKKDGQSKMADEKIVSQSLFTGFAVGLDGSFANLSLAIMGFDSFLVPLSIAFAHALMIALGIALAKTKIAQKFGEISCLPPIILILLGSYKLLGFFI